MKIRSQVLLLALSISSSFYSQNKIKYEKVYFEDNSIETSTGKFSLTNVVSQSDFIKGRVKVHNYTDKAIVIKPEECLYTTPVGEMASKDKWMVIAPRQQEAKTIDIKGDNLKTTETTLKINGLYVCNQVEINVAKNMNLPPEKDLTIGNFKLELEGWDQDGKETMIKYNVRYVGDKIGMFNPSKVILRSPSGSEFKNQKDKEKIYAFNKKEDYVIGFLFMGDSKKDNVLDWKEAFTEGIPEKAEGLSINVKMDEPKTKEKN